MAEALLAATALYMFIVHSLTRDHGFVDPALFLDRNFSASVVIMFAVGVAVISPAVLLPTFLQTLQGYSPTQAGGLMAARGLAAIGGMLAAGRLTGRIPARGLMTTGILLTATALWLMAHFSLDTPWQRVVGANMVLGFGVPLAFVPLTVAAFATLPDAQRAEAGALLTLARNIGSSMGISLSVALLAHSTRANQSQLVEHFTAYSHDRWQLLGRHPGADAGTAAFVAEITRQAGAIAYDNAFYLLALVAAAMLPFLWLLRAPRR